MPQTMTLKALRDERGEVVEKIDDTRKRLRKYATDLSKLDPQADDRAEQFSALKEKIDAAEEELQGYEANVNELDLQIATMKKASAYNDPAVDPGRPAGSDGGATEPNDDDGDGLSFLSARGGDGATDPVSAYRWRQGRELRDNVFQGDSQVIVPERNGRREAIDARILASREYENAWREYTLYSGRIARPDNFERFVKDRSSQYNGLADVIEGIGIPMLPMRIINLFECECPDAYFFRSLATVHNVTEACSLEIWKRGPKVTSFSWGNVCSDPPKSGLPGASAKVLTPWQWTQGAKICRRQLECNAIDPLMLMLRDMEEERQCELEFAYLYGSGFQQPLGLFTDTEIPEHIFAPNEIDTDGCLVDPADSLLKMWCAFPSKCRRRSDLVWIMKDKQWCKLLQRETTGNGCCKHGLHIMDGAGSGMPRVNVLSAPGVPSIPVYVIDDDVCEKLKERSPDHPAHNTLVSLGTLAPYHIADFALGTTLETDDDICTDERVWVRRSFTDGLMVCPDLFLNGRTMTAQELSAKSDKAKEKVAQELTAIKKAYAPQS